MNDDQQTRIAIGSVLVVLISLIPFTICQILGDCKRSKKDAMFALGKTYAKLMRKYHLFRK